MFCRHQDRHMASWGESSNTYRCQGPKDGNGLSSRLKRLYSDTGKQFWEGGEASGSRCTPHQNKPASHDCNYKPSSSLGVNEAFGMMGKEREVMMPRVTATPLTSLISPLNTTSSALSRSIFSFISSWMASASCAACGRMEIGRL